MKSISKKKKRRARSAPISFAADELRALLTAARAESFRDWLMFLVGYWHGLRVSEILGLRKGDVGGGFLTVQRLKGSLKTRQELMADPDPLFNELAGIAAYTRNLRQWDKLFPINRMMAHRLIRYYGEKATIPTHKLHMHTLKSTCGMYFVPQIGLEFTRQRLGHADIRSTQQYARVTDEQTDVAIKKALEKP